MMARPIIWFGLVFLQVIILSAALKQVWWVDYSGLIHRGISRQEAIERFQAFGLACLFFEGVLVLGYVLVRRFFGGP